MESTTLAHFAGQHARNYSSMPTIDVPIIPTDARRYHCASCGGEIVPTADSSQNPYAASKWEHLIPTTIAGHDHVKPRSTCMYCGSDERTAFHQRNWSDETECTRCGGVAGFAIGD